MKLVTKIQALREEKRFTRPQLADKIGVSWETVKAYEVKGAYPSIHVAFKIAKALECSVDDLFIVINEDGLSEEDEKALGFFSELENAEEITE